MLLGETGAGKTTTLRLIAGLDKPTEGQVFIDGVDVAGWGAAERDVALVLQQYSLYPRYTVRENLEFPLKPKIRRLPDAEIKDRVARAARTLRIEHLLDRKTDRLSGGEMQRVSIGRAIVRQPRVFLMDEPLSNLDAKLREILRAELKDLQMKFRATFLYVTHDQVEAMTLGDRVVVMKDGWVQQVGEPLELYGKPANRFVAGFIGSPAMNFVEVSIKDGLWADTAGFRVKVPANRSERLKSYVGQPVTVGIRPEDLHVATGHDAADATFDAVVEVVEPLGSEILLDVKTGGNSLVARVDPTVRVKVHEPIRLALNAERLHFFDKKSEVAI